jgi:hypothetical protein
MTFNYILSRDRRLNQNYKRDYGTISINILLLPARQLGKVAAVS